MVLVKPYRFGCGRYLTSLYSLTRVIGYGSTSPFGSVTRMAWSFMETNERCFQRPVVSRCTMTSFPYCSVVGGDLGTKALQRY